MGRTGLKTNFLAIIIIPLLFLMLTAEGYTAEVIIDNGKAGTSYTGSWSVSGASGYYGSDSVWSRDGATYTWTFTPQTSGTYDISMWWTEWPSRSTNIPVDIQHAGGTKRVYINQLQNGGKWNLLGSFSYSAGVKYKVTIISQPGPSSTCADAVKFAPAGGTTSPPPPDQTMENIYACFGYSPGDYISGFRTMLKSIGATTQDNVLWVYKNAKLNKTFYIHIVTSLDGMKKALQTDGAHILFDGHANYGLGPVFASSAERKAKSIDDIYYIDDKRILNVSSPWIDLNVYDAIWKHAFPNWWPEFRDGTSGIMPYVFGDPRGQPPYNYYPTYRVPGSSTYYKIDSTTRSALRRFPSSGKPAWYSSTGAVPDPVKNPEYFITNSKENTNGEYPKYHYGSRTIIFRKGLEIPVENMKYSRMFFATCYSGIYFTDTFKRGIMFYAVNNISGGSLSVYLKAYLEGKSDYDIWLALQNFEPDFDYYNFNKKPSEQ
jgi:hypothetical protein